MYIRTILFVLLGFSLWTEAACAQDAYRWIDKQGNVVYGSKPPAGAREVKPIKTHNLSRYNSDKVLKRLGWRGGKQSEGVSGELLIGAPKNASQSAPARRELPPHSGPAELEAGEPEITTGEDGQIIACQLKVRNIGSGTAREVSVAIEFPDRTLVPASGPDTIEANGEAQFSVPEGILPIKLKVEGKPRVIVHGASG